MEGQEPTKQAQFKHEDTFLNLYIYEGENDDTIRVNLYDDREQCSIAYAFGLHDDEDADDEFVKTFDGRIDDDNYQDFVQEVVEYIESDE